MEQTFITIHNLAPDANILFVSESVSDILGYSPSEVQGKSCFDYFHPDEMPFARSVHSRGVLLDKAAVLHYARIMSKDGQWVSCECCFTIVHDVLMACTSIYRRSRKQERRAIEAPHIRRLFSSSPRDPRYHMLEHLSPKFKMPPMEREPRAALILNRFTRSLSIMFATNAVASILGVPPDLVQDKSFWECISENCVADAINCLESAKANDSIAYLRFWSRDPRREEDFEDDSDEEEDDDDDIDIKEESPSSDCDSSDGAHLGNTMDIDSDEVAYSGRVGDAAYGLASGSGADQFHSTTLVNGGSGSEFVTHGTTRSTTSPTDSLQQSYRSPSRAESRRGRRRPIPSIELEAVVSCTSDGLVVVLRKARPPMPAPHPPLLPVHPYENGLFAAPWSEEPINPLYPAERFHTFQPPLLTQHMPLQEHVKDAGGPPIEQLMRAIRDVAVFAWALVGINGNIARYGRGVPRGDAQPHDGAPAWDSKTQKMQYLVTEPHTSRQWPGVLGQNGTSTAPYVPGSSAEVPPCYGHTSNVFNGFGGTNFSYTNPPAWSHSTPYTATITAPTQSRSPAPHAQRVQALPPPYRGSPRPQEPWADASSYARQDMRSYSIPTSQPNGTGETHNNYRHMWR